MRARHLRTPLSSVGAGAALLAALAGCTLPNVTMSPGLSHQARPSVTASPTPTEASGTPLVAIPVPLRPSGDLDAGSVTHSLPMGDRTVVIDYWTTQDAKTWTPRTPKSVQLTAHVEGGNPDVQVEVTRFLATTDDGATRSTAAEDRGEFVITPPFNYTTALNLPPSAASATKLTLYVQFDLLVETGRKSGQFFRQTVLDSISLPLLQEDKK